MSGDHDKYHMKVEPLNEFRFFKDETEVLRLDDKGFHYKGQTVDDAGETYRLFVDWMKNSKEQR